MLRVRRQVEVRAVRDALELAPLRTLETEPVLDVHRALGVVRQLLLRVLEEPQVLGRDAEVGVPAGPLVDPVLVPFLVGAGLDEEFHLHLLELAGPEDEVAGCDLVAERLADLADAERRLLARRRQHVEEVDEDALRGLRPQVVQARLVLDGAEVGLQEAVEHPRLGPRPPRPAVRARDAGEAALGRAALALLVLLLQVVGPEPLVARLALHERVDELLHVAGRLPHLPGQDDRGVEADDVVAPGDHVPPPLALDVLLELDAEGSVVPRRTRTAVDLSRGVHESPALAEIDDSVESGFARELGGHGTYSNRSGRTRRTTLPVAGRPGSGRPGVRGAGRQGGDEPGVRIPGEELLERGRLVDSPVHERNGVQLDLVRAERAPVATDRVPPSRQRPEGGAVGGAAEDGGPAAGAG